jgi:hypothetical protein
MPRLVHRRSRLFGGTPAQDSFRGRFDKKFSTSFRFVLPSDGVNHFTRNQLFHRQFSPSRLPRPKNMKSPALRLLRTRSSDCPYRSGLKRLIAPQIAVVLMLYLLCGSARSADLVGGTCQCNCQSNGNRYYCQGLRINSITVNWTGFAPGSIHYTTFRPVAKPPYESYRQLWRSSPPNLPNTTQLQIGLGDTFTSTELLLPAVTLLKYRMRCDAWKKRLGAFSRNVGTAVAVPRC